MSFGDSIFLTGGAGFLGRALIARATREGWGSRITIYSRDEEKQWRVRNRWPHVNCILGDITDRERLVTAMVGHETVIHMAAHKFVPEAERDVTTAVRANVHGSMAVAEAANLARVKSAILISTDKASDPTNVYGMSKALAERIWSEYYREAKYTRFRVARYGNVIGSTGSAMPLFISQFKAGKTPTITDPHMTRFLMSVDEGIDTIAAAHAGDAFITVPVVRSAWLLDMLKASSIVADAEFTWEHIGPRPGEKTHETTISAREMRLVTGFDGLFYQMLPEAERSKIHAVTPSPIWRSGREVTGITSEALNPKISPEEIAAIYSQTVAEVLS